MSNKLEFYPLMICNYAVFRVKLNQKLLIRQIKIAIKICNKM